MKDKQNGFHCGEKEEMIKLSEETGDARDTERKKGEGSRNKDGKKKDRLKEKTAEEKQGDGKENKNKQTD